VTAADKAVSLGLPAGLRSSKEETDPTSLRLGSSAPADCPAPSGMACPV
jgi:hypothetical protein